MSNMKIISSNIVGYYSYKPDIQIKKYENGKEVDEPPQIECAICKVNLCEPSYETITDNKNIFRETEITLGKCGHMFHADCIDKWLKISSDCPIDHVHWCRLRELNTTTRLVLANNNFKGYKNNYNSTYNKTNNINKNNVIKPEEVKIKLEEHNNKILESDSESEADY